MNYSEKISYIVEIMAMKSGDKDIYSLEEDEEDEVIENMIISGAAAGATQVPMHVVNTPVKKPESRDNSGSNVFIPKETMERLLKDIRDIFTSSLDKDRIYYKHSDTNILKAYVMIVGPPDSLYFGGYYFFEITFPMDYPHAPPLVEYLTNDGVTRFHPNFYKSKRVCLSMLNTWRGEQWTSCLTIKSVLLTLVSIMDSKPMLHEPGVTEKHNDFNNYHTMILFKNIDFSCIELLNHFMNTTIIGFDSEYKEYFYSIMMDEFKRNAKKIKDIVIHSAQVKNINKVYSISGMYNMSFHVDFNKLLEKLNMVLKKNYICVDA